MSRPTSDDLEDVALEDDNDDEELLTVVIESVVRDQEDFENNISTMTGNKANATTKTRQKQ